MSKSLTEELRKELEKILLFHSRQLNALGLTAAINTIAGLSLCKEFQSKGSVNRAYFCTTVSVSTQPFLHIVAPMRNGENPVLSTSERVNRVKEFRTKAGLSQDALAKKASISRPFLSSIENGAAIPTIKTATAIAVALGKTLDEIFSDHE